MEVIYIVLPLAVVMALVALSAFFWAVHKGQFDDLDTPAYRALLEEELNAKGRSGEETP
jgi:cbb3-type cytochrome oxidase maturation protein